jgi:hypothetical protein
MQITKINNWTYILVFIIFLIRPIKAGELATGALVGYNGGPGILLNTMITPSDDLPITFRLGAGYTFINPGDAVTARNVFVHDSTDSTASKHGSVQDFRFDFLYRANWFLLDKMFIYAGPRYQHYSGLFDFPNSQESFNVKGVQWGIGIGFEAYFKVSEKMELVIRNGFDHYFPNTLSSLDTVYSPNGDDINPKGRYSYNDANEAITQPRLEIRWMIGFHFMF